MVASLIMKLTGLKFLARRGKSVRPAPGFRGYPAFFEHVLKTRPRDEAMIEAVGGGHDIGDMEVTLLDRFGLKPDDYVIDIGCGSGRLARPLAKLSQLRYLGTDISQTLLDYAAKSCGRADFRFERVEGTQIPETDGAADIVAFFSVGTHLLQEDFFLYLEDARRVLKPGGRIIFSFLDVTLPGVRVVFRETVEVARSGRRFHLNTFMGHSDIPAWAEMLQMKLIDVLPGDHPVGEASPAVRAVLSESVADRHLGQSVAVFEKP
jgi:SAM-dependent methyltransferase